MSTDNPASGGDMHLFGFMPSTGHANCICGWSSAPVKDRTEARAEYNVHTAAQSPGHSPALGDPTACRNCLATRWEYDRDPCTRAACPMRPDPSSVAVPPTEEQRGQRYHASYEAVYAYIGTLAGGVPLDVVHRNAMIWRAVQAALDAIPATTGEPASFAPAAEPPTQLGASAVREFVPDWVLPPGDILAAEMQARRETVYSISDGAPFGVKLVEDVLAARAAVTEELARWLEQSWGTPAEFWLRLEALWQDHSADAVVAAREEGIRIGREAAAQAILAHADKIAPRDDPVKSTMRRHLRIGAQVAANPATREQVAAAIESLARPSIPIVCHLDEAGQSVVVADAP